MTKKPTPVPPFTSEDIHAYVDGQMPADRIEDFEAYLADNPLEAAKVTDYQKINNAMEHALGGTLKEPVPTELLDVVNRQGSPSFARAVAGVLWPNVGVSMRIAASSAWLVAGLGIGWYANNSRSLETDLFARLGQAAQTAYTVYSPESLHPVEIMADQRDHLSSWLSKRLERHVPIPSLMDLGYAFVGGRLLTGYQKPAAMLMYQDAKGQRLVLYVSTELAPGQEAPMAFDQSSDTSVVTWARGGTGFGIAGSFPEDELMPAANLIRAQISI